MKGNYYYEKLGETIIKTRKSKSLSQDQLAILSDVDRSYLAEVEEGKANPSIKFLHKIAKVLKVKVGQLLKEL